MRACAVAAAVAAILVAAAASSGCLAPYQLCPNTGDCVLWWDACGACGAGEYLCPLQPQDGSKQLCAADAEAYESTCWPTLQGTHLDWTLSIDERVQYLVEHANLTEKLSQMTNNAPHLQRWGLPWYNWLNDDLHGVRTTHATSFPNGCGLGATWSKLRLWQVGRAIGLEARAGFNGYTEEGNRAEGLWYNGLGITMYAPNVNLVRDPRWGRSQEVYSEDPALSSALVYQFVTGAQGSDTNTSYLLTAACCKHFAVYDLDNIPVNRNVFDAVVDARNMWETYMPVFRSCVVRAQGTHVMCAYNSVNGAPACGNRDLLNGILREQWNWPGFVVSDYDAWAQIMETHEFCSSYECAGSVGLKAGCDQEGGGTSATLALPAALAAGNVTQAEIDQAFGRILRVRIQLGMLDPPTLVPYNQLSNSTVEDDSHLAFARQVARESICLYSNKNNVLPLKKSSIKKLAVIGPSAQKTYLLQGNYGEPPDKGIVSILEGIRNAMGTPVTCELQQGTNFTQVNGWTTPTVNASICCQQCMGSLDCSHFSWYQGQCTLMPNISAVSTAPGYVSGVCPDPSTAAVVYAPGCTDIRCLPRRQWVHRSSSCSQGCGRHSGGHWVGLEH